MAIVEQKHGSTSGSFGALRRGYTIRDCFSADDAIDLTVAAAPVTIPALTGATDPNRNKKRWLVDVEVQEISERDATGATATSHYETQAVYGYLAACPIFHFDSGSQTVRITQSESVRSITTRDGGGTGNRADFAGAINIDTDGGTFRVQGADRFEPEGRFNLTWNPPLTMSLDETYWQYATDMVWKVNSVEFYGTFPPQTLLMTGISGRPIDQRNDRWEVTMSFAYRSTQTNVVIDGITVPEIKGWDYVDPTRERTVGSLSSPSGTKTSFLFPKINQITVHQLYPADDFNSLFYRTINAGAPLEVEGCRGFDGIPTTRPA